MQRRSQVAIVQNSCVEGRSEMALRVQDTVGVLIRRNVIEHVLVVQMGRKNLKCEEKIEKHWKIPRKNRKTWKN